MSGWRPFVQVLLPFAAAYFLSYVFRTINALIAGTLTRELSLSAADLGLLTSVYFLAMAAVQLPLGVLLDRYGPRRVQSACLLFAAVGAAVFACAEGLLGLMLGRALIGVGVATALMSSLKAIVLWFPKERIAFANGWVVMLGALGAVTATLPAEPMVNEFGWRGLFALLAGATTLAAAVMFLVVPEPATRSTPSPLARVRLRDIYRDTRFLRLAPLSTLCIGRRSSPSTPRGSAPGTPDHRAARANTRSCRRPTSCARRPQSRSCRRTPENPAPRPSAFDRWRRCGLWC